MMFCFHKYKIHSQTITKSNVEIARENGYSVPHARVWDFEKNKLVVFKCEKCGMMKQRTFNEMAIIKE